MRYRKQFFLLAILAAAAAFLLIPPGAHAEERDQEGRAQVIVIDGDGDHHVRSWVMGHSGWLGVTLQQDRGSDGAVIIGVAEDSPAARLGLEEGDVIVGVDDEEVGSPSDLIHHIRGLEPGDQVELEVSRGGNRERMVAELDEMPGNLSLFGFGEHAPFAFDFDGEGFEEHLRELEEKLSGMNLDIRIPEIQMHGAPGFAFEFGGFGRPVLGVQTIPATPELREHLGGPRDAGVLIGKIVEGMPAEEAGLSVGDSILSVDDEKIEDAGDLRRALHGRSGDTINLEIVRDGRAFDVDVLLPERDEDQEFRAPSRPIHHPMKEHVPTQKA